MAMLMPSACGAAAIGGSPRQPGDRVPTACRTIGQTAPMPDDAALPAGPARWRAVAVIGAIGTLAGVFSGLFGVGGGLVMVPLLIAWRGLDERRATSTSLGAIAVISAAAVVAQVPYGTLHPWQGLLLGVPALGGVLLGTAVQQRLPLHVVAGLFGVLMLAVAVTLVLVPGEESGTAPDLTAPLVLAALALGVVAGVLSGLLGVGGGLVFVPALVYVLGLDHVAAEATSLLAILPAALLGAWRQHRYGNLEIGTAAGLGALAIPGAVLGVALAHALPVDALRLGFAVLLAFVAQRFVRRGLAGARRRPSPAASGHR